MDRNQGLKIGAKINNILIACGLLEDTPDSQITNEDYIIKVLMEFLNKVGIDANEIRTTKYNDLSVLYPETLREIIQIANIQSSISAILKEVYINDFCLNDIINAEIKEISKIFQYISNFYLYYHDKINDIDHGIKNINLRHKKIQDLKEQIRDYERKTEQIIRRKECIFKTKQNLQQEIEKRQLDLAKRNEAKKQLQDKIQAAKLNQQKNQEILINHKLKLVELNELKASLEKNVVKTPINYIGQLEKLEKIKDDKQNEVFSLRNIIMEKKKDLEHKEKLIKFVEQANLRREQLCKNEDRYVAATKCAKLLDQQLDELRSAVQKRKQDHEKDCLQKQNLDENVSRLRSECQEKIQKLTDERTALIKDVEQAEKKLQKYTDKKNKIETSTQNMYDLIAEITVETDRIVQECQEICRKEMDEVSK